MVYQVTRMCKLASFGNAAYSYTAEMIVGTYMVYVTGESEFKISPISVFSLSYFLDSVANIGKKYIFAFWACTHQRKPIMITPVFPNYRNSKEFWEMSFLPRVRRDVTESLSVQLNPSYDHGCTDCWPLNHNIISLSNSHY